MLKMTIQWIAAAMAQKELVYYCYGDANLATDLTSVVQKYNSKSAGLHFLTENWDSVLYFYEYR